MCTRRNYSSLLVLPSGVHFLSYGAAILSVFMLLFIDSERAQLSDSILYSIDWSGPVSHLQSPVQQDSLDSLNEMFVMTANKEQYKCILPDVSSQQDQEDIGMSSKYTELELLKPLFYQNSCTYRVEPYWSYEMCHGKYLRQYHEEKDNVQEYYLGKYNMKDFSGAIEQERLALQNEGSNPENSRPRVRNVLGTDVQYYSVSYIDGTLCDVTGLPRRVSVLYVCHSEGRGEVYEIREASSCEYEAIVLTSLLCSHPKYGPKKESVNKISCHSVNGAPKRPQHLEDLELEHSTSKHNIEQDEIVSRILEALSSLIDKANAGDDGTDIEMVGADDDSPTAHNDDDTDILAERGGIDRPQQGGYVLSSVPPRQTPDRQILKNFLAGVHCVSGGTGWWKHEFCYGRHVLQYHEDRASRTEILLGVWNKERHVKWVLESPRRAPRPAQHRRSLTHFYSDGDSCDLTGRPRFVEVRLKCAASSSHPNSISLYLVESKPCEYKLVVESQLLCLVIKEADETGIIPDGHL